MLRRTDVCVWYCKKKKGGMKDVYIKNWNKGNKGNHITKRVEAPNQRKKTPMGARQEKSE